VCRNADGDVPNLRDLSKRRSAQGSGPAENALEGRGDKPTSIRCVRRRHAKRWPTTSAVAPASKRNHPEGKGVNHLQCTPVTLLILVVTVGRLLSKRRGDLDLAHWRQATSETTQATARKSRSPHRSFPTPHSDSMGKCMQRVVIRQPFTPPVATAFSALHASRRDGLLPGVPSRRAATLRRTAGDARLPELQELHAGRRKLRGAGKTDSDATPENDPVRRLRNVCAPGSARPTAVGTANDPEFARRELARSGWSEGVFAVFDANDSILVRVPGGEGCWMIPPARQSPGTSIAGLRACPS